MDINTVKKVIKAAFNADDTVIVQSVHGLGKSSAVKQFAKENNMHCEQLFLSMLDIGDLLGIPKTVKVGSTLVTSWASPDFFNTIIDKAFPQEVLVADLTFQDPTFQDVVTPLGKAISRDSLNSLYAKHYSLVDNQLYLTQKASTVSYNHAKGSVLFLDELNRSSLDIRQAALQLILEKELHCHKLPYVNGKPTMIVAAINPSDAYAVDELDAALLDRFLFVEVEPDAKSWLDYARANNLNEIVRSFISEHPDRIFDQPKDGSIGATPRSWEKLATFMDDAKNIPPEILFDIIKGKIGRTLATQFLQFFNNYSKVIKLADVEKVITKAKKVNPDLSHTSAAVAKLLENQEVIQKSELANQFYDKYIDLKDDKAYPLLAMLYALDIEILAGFLKTAKATDIAKYMKLSVLDTPNNKDLFKKITSRAQ